MLALCCCLLALCVRGARSVNNVTVLWSIEGVQSYLAVESALKIQLGDNLFFLCPNGSFSNIIYQTEEAQYDACNSSAVSNGARITAGTCFGRGADRAMIEIAQSSGEGSSIQQYRAGRKYFYSSYSDGSSLLNAHEQITSGGECLDGLKMVISVLPSATDPSSTSTPSSPNTGGNEGTGPTLPLSTGAIIGIAVGGAVGVVLFVLLIAVCCCCWYKCKSTGSVELKSNKNIDTESGHELRQSSKGDSKKQPPKNGLRSTHVPARPLDSVSSTQGLLPKDPTDDIDSNNQNNPKQSTRKQAPTGPPPDKPGTKSVNGSSKGGVIRTRSSAPPPPSNTTTGSQAPRKGSKNGVQSNPSKSVTTNNTSDGKSKTKTSQNARDGENSAASSQKQGLKNGIQASSANKKGPPSSGSNPASGGRSSQLKKNAGKK